MPQLSNQNKLKKMLHFSKICDLFQFIKLSSSSLNLISEVPVSGDDLSFPDFLVIELLWR